MSKIKLLTIAVVALLMVNIGIVVFLFTKKAPMPPDGGPLMGMQGRPPGKDVGPKIIIIERLQFDKEQIQAYEKLIQVHQVAIELYGDSIKVAKNNLYQSLQTKNLLSNDSLINKLSRLQKQIELVHYNHFVELKKICKPEQLVAFNALTEELAGFFAPNKKNRKPPKDSE